MACWWKEEEGGLITFIFSVKMCYSVHDLFGHVDTLLFLNVLFIWFANLGFGCALMNVFAITGSRPLLVDY